METLYAYLAGAIDIDGRISISRARGYRRDREMAYYSAVISLSDSDPVLPDLLQATFPARRLQCGQPDRRFARAMIWPYVGSSGPKRTRAAHSPAALSQN